MREIPLGRYRCKNIEQHNPTKTSFHYCINPLPPKKNTNNNNKTSQWTPLLLFHPNPKLTIFGEGDGGDRPLVSLEVGDIGPFLQIPDLDDRVLGARGKDQAVRVELGTGQGRH